MTPERSHPDTEDQRVLLERLRERSLKAWLPVIVRSLRDNGVLLFFGSSWTLTSLVVFVVFWFAFGSPLAERRLERNGARCQGAISDVRLNTSLSIDDEHPYQVAYEFLDLMGKKYLGRCNVWSESRANELKKSGIATIVYLPTDPAVNKLEGTSYSSLPAWVLVLILVFSLIGLIPLRLALREPIRTMQLAMRGVPVLARLDSIRRLDRNRADLVLSYQTRSGEQVQTVRRVTGLECLPDLNEGQEVAILGDPTTPGRVVLGEELFSSSRQPRRR